MFLPYTLIEKGESVKVYQYNPLYSWLIWGAFLPFLAALLLNKSLFATLFGLILMFVYFLKILLSITVQTEIRQGMKNGQVILNGKQFSWSKPLTVTIKQPNSD